MEQIYLNLIPGGVSPVCYVSQYDVGRKIRLHLREGSDPYVLSGAETINATIRKATGEELIYDIANTSASYVDLVVNYDATDVIGESVCELVIYNSGVKLGSANFKMRIDPDVYSGDERLEIRTASGDPATFETNIVDNIPELKCNINAIQDGTPWIDSNIVNKEPYLFRKIAGTASRIGNSEFTTLIGGTVAFNQLVQNGNFADTSGWSFTNGTATASSNVCHFTFNATANRTELYCFIANTNSAHDYLFAYTIKSSKAVSVASVGGAISRTFGSLNANQEYVNMTIVKGGNNTLLDIYTDGSFENGDTVDYKNIVLIDLTQMFGTTIADYVYTLESGTAGVGITWLKNNGFDFSKYAPFNAGGLLSVKTSKKINVGFNQWDEQWELGSFSWSTGVPFADNTRIRNKNYIPVFPNVNYFNSNSGYAVDYYFYDADKNFISPLYKAPGNQMITTPANCYYMNFCVYAAYGTTYNNDICINISDASKNGQYQPYVSHEYDLSGNRKVHRVFGIVDLGSLNWVYGGGIFTTFDINDFPVTASGWEGLTNFKCSKYTYSNWDLVDNPVGHNKQMCMRYVGGQYYTRISDSDYTDAETFKTAMQNANAKLVYELATPFDETVSNPELRGVLKLDSDNNLYYFGDTCSDFTNPQLVDGNGTEQFIDGRTVEMPVGHESYYANICEINGYRSCDITRAGKNLLDTATYEDGQALEIYLDKLVKYPSASNCSIVKLPLPAGTYTLSHHGTFSDVVYACYYDENENAHYIANNQPPFSFTLPNKAFVGFTFPTMPETEVKEFQLEVGNQATAFEAYAGETIKVDWGINQWDEVWENGGYDNTTGEPVETDLVIRNKNTIAVTPNTKYFAKTPATIRLFEYDANGNYISTSTVNNEQFTISENTKFLNWHITAADFVENSISINYPATETGYHSYKGHGIIYGGTLDVTTGTLTVTHFGLDLGSLDYSLIPNANGAYFYAGLGENPLSVVNANCLCSIYESSTVWFILNTTIDNAVGVEDTYIAIRNSAYNDANAFKKDMSGIKLVYELATPINIQLTPHQVEALLGLNNVYHTANGGTEVKFFRLVSAT